jgi:TRAP-type C4-dicarboxylate transport system permease small subunit
MFTLIVSRLVSILSYLNTVLVLPALVTLVLSDIVLRTFFSAPIAWAHELSGLLLLTMFFLAIPSCIEREELLSVDLLYQGLSTFKQKVLRLVSHTFLLAFSFLVVWQAYLGARDSLEYGDQAYTIDLPYWPFYILMAFIGCVTACQSLLKLWFGLGGNKEGRELYES